MSNWTYIDGIIRINPLGRTGEEKQYILHTVLNHLPLVQGSEGDMEIYVNEIKQCHSSSNCDEFMQKTNNMKDRFGNKSRRHGWMQIPEDYIITIHGALRDINFNEGYKMLQKWLVQLAKRLSILDTFIRVNDNSKMSILNTNAYFDIFENPSWCNIKHQPKSHNWCEYLMWEHHDKTKMPVKLTEKYDKEKNHG